MSVFNKRADFSDWESEQIMKSHRASVRTKCLCFGQTAAVWARFRCNNSLPRRQGELLGVDRVDCSSFWMSGIQI